jgi:hypothetical protein
VLFDGEGLGHTPSTSASVSTTVSRRIGEVDAALLVDSAAQPMQAAPVAEMRELARSGNAAKLIVVFTHFDEVKGDNPPTLSAKGPRCSYPDLTPPADRPSLTQQLSGHRLTP